ncbi:MAG: hypothetical protein KJ063_25165 [Anaerolineae bacterium]|nr:hypothetical protein [Anaerolineae bacterium]
MLHKHIYIILSIHLVLVLLLLVVVACRPYPEINLSEDLSAQDESKVTRAITQTLPIEPRPRHILDIHPPERSRQTLLEFRRMDYFNENYSNICVKWHPAWPGGSSQFFVVEVGDEGFDIEEADERTSLIVNQQEVLSGTHIMFTLQSMVTLQDGQEIGVGGPFISCWPITAEVGRTHVTFQVRKTSGNILSYSWYFDLTP